MPEIPRNKRIETVNNGNCDMPVIFRFAGMDNILTNKRFRKTVFLQQCGKQYWFDTSNKLFQVFM